MSGEEIVVVEADAATDVAVEVTVEAEMAVEGWLTILTSISLLVGGCDVSSS